MAGKNDLSDIVMPEGTIVTRTKYLGAKWEKEYLAAHGITNDAEVKEVQKDFRGRFTITINFDFSGTNSQQHIDQLASTTSYSKMLYNNNLGDLKQEEAEEICKQPYDCHVLTMLAERKTREADPMASAKAKIKKAKEKGATKEQLTAMIEEMYG